MRYALIGAALLLLVVGGGALYVWRMMSAPLYAPGMVRAGETLRSPLSPPEQQENGNRWRVEENIELHHFAEGTGRNVLVVHGGPGFAFPTPVPGLSRLKERYRFVYYDQRGGGRSTRPIDAFDSNNYYANLMELNGALGLAAHIADIERIRRILGDDKLNLVGYSFGGFIASMYAAEFPDHVASLVLVAPADMLVFPAKSGDLFARIRQELPNDKHSEFDTWRSEYLDFKNVFSKTEANLQQLNARFGQYYTAAMGLEEEPVNPQDEPFAPPGWVVQAIYLSMGMSHDYRASLASVQAPVLVVHGQRDLQPIECSRHYVEAYPNAELETIPDATHFLMTEHPDPFAELVGAFLDRVASTEGS